MKNNTIPLISVVIPCFNEGELIDELHRRLNKVESQTPEFEFEFIIVNDGSSDSSGQALNDNADVCGHFKIIHLGRNFGHQIAIAAGMDYARGDAIIIMDGDLQDPPELIPEIAHKILEDGYDVVHMQRRKRDGETWFKLVCARVFYWTFNKITNTDFIPNCGDFRGVSKRALDVVRRFREPHKFHRAAFAHVGFKQLVMPFDRDPRYAGETKYPFWSLVRLASNGLMSFSAAPLKLVLSLSILLWGFAAVVAIKALYGKLVMSYEIPGWTTNVVLQVFLAGLMLFALAIIGEYIRRIFEQGKDRPLYWIHESRNLPLQEFDQFREQRVSRLTGYSVISTQRKNQPRDILSGEVSRQSERIFDSTGEVCQ